MGHCNDSYRERQGECSGWFGSQAPCQKGRMSAAKLSRGKNFQMLVQGANVDFHWPLGCQNFSGVLGC